MPASKAIGAPTGTVPQHLCNPWLLKGAWSARKSIIAFLGSAHDIKAHAASCLGTFDMEQQDGLLSSVHNTNTHQATRVIFDPGLEVLKAEKVKGRMYEPEPLQKLTTLTQPDKRAFEANHANGIIHGVLYELEDHEDQETFGYTADDSNDVSVS